jgi:hypothetical protein
MTGKEKFLKQFKAARRVSTPLVAVQTPDPAACIRALSAVVKVGDKDAALVIWDAVNGLRSLNDLGTTAVADACGNTAEGTVDPVQALIAAGKLPAHTVVFFKNAHRYLADPVVVQAVWNLRDNFKRDYRALVMLCPSMQLPEELGQDVLVLDEPLPSAEELTAIIEEAHASAKLRTPDVKDVQRSVEALSGLSAFTAEQVTAMSLTKQGIDKEALWERKRQTIEQAPGLSVHRGGERFDDIGGVANAKKFLLSVINGNEPPNAIVFIDEIEKALAGAKGDTSGVSQEMLGALLTWMQEKHVGGVIAIGPPGCSKSLIAKATGNTAGVPTIQFDLSGMKGSLVGESGKNLRNALKVVDAVSNGRVLCIATCNSIADLPPELRRRFTFGTFFFDLPTPEERKAIWNIYIDKYEFTGKAAALPSDIGWTGAEIKQCCELAHRLNTTLKEASTYIVPVARSAAESIERLRQQANGRFINAAAPGVYAYNKVADSSGGRSISTE